MMDGKIARAGRDKLFRRALHRQYAIVGAAVLLLALLGELTLSVRNQSLSWDEGDHLFAGYMSWKTGDFGINPEHPPLVKALAAVPLLSMHLRVPPPRGAAFFKTEAYFGGRDLIFDNGGEPVADRIVFRARMAAATLSLLLGVFVILGQLLRLSSESWWKHSLLIPYGESVANGLRSIVGEAHIGHASETHVHK